VRRSLQDVSAPSGSCNGSSVDLTMSSRAQSQVHRFNAGTLYFLISPKTSLFFFVLWRLLEFYLIIIHYLCLLLCLQPRVFRFTHYHCFTQRAPWPWRCECATTHNPNPNPNPNLNRTISPELYPFIYCLTILGVFYAATVGFYRCIFFRILFCTFRCSFYSRVFAFYLIKNTRLYLYCSERAGSQSGRWLIMTPEYLE
jgi:hypothetical protein